MADWRRGYVHTPINGHVRVYVGQRWGYLRVDEAGIIDPDACVLMEVVFTCPEGEVALRPSDAASATKVFSRAGDHPQGQNDGRACGALHVGERGPRGFQCQ